MAGKKKKKKKPVKHRDVDIARYLRPCQDFVKAHIRIICAAVIALLGLIVYSDSLRGPFVFDDVPIIVNDPIIRSIGGLFADPVHSRLVGYLTFALNYRISGFNVTGYHLFNIAVHMVSAVMVFWVVLLTFRTPFFQTRRTGEASHISEAITIALFSGLIFVAHPVQTQAVTYIVQRFASLATLFFLLSIIMYAKWRLTDSGPVAIDPEQERMIGPKGKRIIFYFSSLVAALLAMGTKEIAFTLPAILILWEFSFFSGGIKKRIMNLLPFVLTTLVIPLMFLARNEPLLSARGFTEPPPAIDYFFTQCRVIVTYLRLLYFPVNQNLDYDYPVLDSFFNPAVLFSFLFILATVGAGAYLYYRSSKRDDSALLRLAGFGIFWFFITLSVESSFISIADVIFEHRLYLPSIGLIFATVALVAQAVYVMGKRYPQISRVAIALALIVVVALSVSAYSRNKVWGDSITLWEDVVSKSSGKSRPHNNLGREYQLGGQSEKAEAEFRLAIDINPDDPESHYNLGATYQQKGQHDKAEAELLQAIALNPDYADAHYNLGVNFQLTSQPEKAEAEFLRAVALNPGHGNAHYNLGTIYQQRGELDKAETELHLAVNSNPGDAGAFYNLGMNYVYQDRFTEAIYPFKKVIELDPGNYEAHNNLGNIYLTQNRFDQALQEYQAALKIKPDYQDARDNLQYLQSVKS